MRAGSKRTWSQSRRRGGSSDDDDDLDWRVGDADDAPPRLTDFSGWTTAQLRTFLDERGAEHEMCTEHADLVCVTRLTDALLMAD